MNECVGKPDMGCPTWVRQPDSDCVPAGSGCRGVDSESVDRVVVLGCLAALTGDRAAVGAVPVGWVACRVLK